MGRFKIASFSLPLALLFINNIQSSHGLSVSCMIDYDNGGAPAVYDSQECPTQWVLFRVSLERQNLKNCQFAMLQGRRAHQEDRVVCHLDMKLPLLKINSLDFEDDTVGIVAVFDGHGGKEASEIASILFFDYFKLHFEFQSYKLMGVYKGELPLSDYKAIKLGILREALLRTISDIDLKFTEEAIKNNYFSGSTANVVLLYDGQILVANVGDSKALLMSEKFLSGDLRVNLSATEMTYDHHPDREDEKARIKAAGGSVTRWGVPRVNGVLAMSRSIGDVALKRFGVIAEPEFTGWKVLTANDCYLVVASDGIFESLKPQDVAEVIFEWNLFQEGSTESKLPLSCTFSESLAECIITIAYEKGSHDNLSAIVVPLR